MKTRMKIFQLKAKSVFLPKIREDQKKRTLLKFSFVRFSVLNYVKAKKRSSLTVSVPKPSPQVTKGGGGMPQFCILFNANYTILATQRGGAWPNGPPLNTPLKAGPHLSLLEKQLVHDSDSLLC